MQRDDNLIRSLMFEAEASADWRIVEVGGRVLSPKPEDNKRAYHFELLCDAGLCARIKPGIFRLTNDGHDWLAAVRDDTVWKNTTEAAAKVGGASLKILGSIATGFVKQKLRDLGVPLDS